jgi:hypothetical protein
MHKYAVKGVEQKMKSSPPVNDAAFIDKLSPFWKSLPLHLGSIFYQYVYGCIPV